MTLRAGLKDGPPVAPVPGADSSLIGVAVEFVLPVLDGAVREPHIGGAPTLQLADHRATAARLALAEPQRLGGGAALTGPSLERAADCALVCARLEQHFRMGPARARDLALPDPATGVPDGLGGIIGATKANAATRSDLVTLLDAAIHDTADLYKAEPLYIDPVFALSGALGGADADVIADGVLIDFKASKDRSVIGSTDIHQLIGYALADLDDWYAIHTVGIHAVRWRTRWTVPIDHLHHVLSGVERPLMEWREEFARVLEAGRDSTYGDTTVRTPNRLAEGANTRSTGHSY